MKSQWFVFILIAIFFFVCGYCTSIIFPNQKQNINIYGTYVNGFSTISIRHDSTYQYTYPFTSGKFK